MNVHSGAQAFPMDEIGRSGDDPPCGPSADWRMLTTADAAGTNGLTCLPKHGGTRDRRFLITHPMTYHCERPDLSLNLLKLKVFSITRLRALKGSRKISNFTICLLENIKVELKKENYSLVEKKKDINAQKIFFLKSEDIKVNEIAINPLKKVKEVLERFNVVNKKVQSPGLDIGEGNKLIVSLKEFVKNIRQQSDQKLKEYEEKAKKLSTSVGTDYSGINKRRITSKFSDKSTDKVSVNGAEKVKRDTHNVALVKMIMDLNKRSQAYETYSKKLNF
ncbi:hypothetical protein evm_014355 [Chilo suppressalis]|nr:hypothetical protein evm_014355 [Chilo suppressalis]